MFLHEAVDILSSVRDPLKTVQSDHAVIHVARIGKRLRSGTVLFATLDQWPGIASHAAEAAGLMRRALPFVFRDGEADIRRGDLGAPRIGPAGMRLFNEGRLTLPSEVVWLEYRGKDKDVGLLAVKGAGAAIDVRIFGFRDQPKDFMGPTVGRVLEYGCFRTTIQPSSAPERPADVPSAESEFVFRTHDPLGHAAAYDETIEADPEMRARKDPSSDWMLAPSGWAIMEQSKALHAVYLLLMLASRKKTIEPVQPSPMENRRRADKGLFRIPPYHVVTPQDDWTPEEGFTYPKSVLEGYGAGGEP